MTIAYFVPVDAEGFTTRAGSADRRELWCKNCAEPCDKSLKSPEDHVAITKQQCLESDSCRVCGTYLLQGD